MCRAQRQRAQISVQYVYVKVLFDTGARDSIIAAYEGAR